MLHATRTGFQDAPHVHDERAHLGQLLFELLALEAGELGEAHVENRFGLTFAQSEPRLQLLTRLRRIVRPRE